jgi:hypothetical protein
MSDKRALQEIFALTMIFRVSEIRRRSTSDFEMEGSSIGRWFFIVDMPGMLSRKMFLRMQQIRRTLTVNLEQAWEKMKGTRSK